ncbi:MAG TPA: hypothetical protein VM557_07670 [Thermoanaerobaculia bacterium]|nr:hypothetical protein [Thermoanaerobaculia bacterium]
MSLDLTAGYLFPVAAITLMLWLLWSESIRHRPMPRPWYFFRALLYLGLGGVMAYNGWRYGRVFQTMNWVFLGVAMAVSIMGAIFFMRKGMT